MSNRLPEWARQCVEMADGLLFQCTLGVSDGGQFESVSVGRRHSTPAFGQCKHRHENANRSDGTERSDLARSARDVLVRGEAISPSIDERRGKTTIDPRPLFPA